MNTPPRMYTIGLLNDLHYHFPELLYRPERFQSVQDVLRYIGEVASQNPYERNREAYLRANSASSSTSSSSSSSSRGRRISQPVYQRSSTGFSSLFGGSPLTSNVRINIPLPSSSGAAVASSSSMGDPLLSSLLTGLLGGDSPSGSLSDLYFHVLQRGGVETEQNVPTQDDVYRATSIPTIHDVVEGTCSICQEPCQSEGPTCRRINHCGHLFHLTCIDTWFQTHSTCPMCRYDIRQG